MGGARWMGDAAAARAVPPSSLRSRADCSLFLGFLRPSRSRRAACRARPGRRTCPCCRRPTCPRRACRPLRGTLQLGVGVQDLFQLGLEDQADSSCRSRCRPRSVLVGLPDAPPPAASGTAAAACRIRILVDDRGALRGAGGHVVRVPGRDRVELVGGVRVGIRERGGVHRAALHAGVVSVAGTVESTAPRIFMASPSPPPARTRRPFQPSSVFGGAPLPMNSYCGRSPDCRAWRSTDPCRQ